VLQRIIKVDCGLYIGNHEAGIDRGKHFGWREKRWLKGGKRGCRRSRQEVRKKDCVKGVFAVLLREWQRQEGKCGR
jgi:hypothetical protein